MQILERGDWGVLVHVPELQLADYALKAMLQREHALLKAKGWADDDLPATAEVIGVYLDSAPIAAFAFEQCEDMLWLYMTVVLERHRGQGHYQRMWSYLVKQAQRRKVATIDSSVHVANEVSRACATRRGSMAEYLIYTYKVKPNA